MTNKELLCLVTHYWSPTLNRRMKTIVWDEEDDAPETRIQP